MVDLFVVLIFIIIGLLVLWLLWLLTRKSQTDRLQTEAIKDLERRMTDLMTSQLKEIRDTQNGTSRVMHEQIRSFTKETTRIREGLKQVQEKIKDVASFQEIFKSPKLRGQWGEASLQHILGEFFPQELWQAQYSFSSGERVDAVLKLPNGKLLSIDSKFSSDNFERMIHAENEETRKSYQQVFLQDVKKRIDEVSGKYILPSEGTIDFALMYIPAEAIYYEIMFNLREQDIPNYARAKKVVLASPNTIYLTLRTIENWFRDTQISKRTQEILKRLERVHQDAKKLGETFRKLGTHLKNVLSSYEDSEKRVSLLGERVEQLLEIKETKQLESEKNGV